MAAYWGALGIFPYGDCLDEATMDGLHCIVHTIVCCVGLRGISFVFCFFAVDGEIKKGIILSPATILDSSRLCDRPPTSESAKWQC